jgi:transcription elongation GreA/GreB family factor
VIQTSAVGFDGRAELVSRLRFLREVEIPRLDAEQGDGVDLGTAALRAYAGREAGDIERILDQLSTAEHGPDQVVRLNDCVTVYNEADGLTEEMIVHSAGLNVRAPGFISVDSPLGGGVIGRRLGDLVEIEAPGGSMWYVIRGIRRG